MATLAALDIQVNGDFSKAEQAFANLRKNIDSNSSAIISSLAAAGTIAEAFNNAIAQIDMKSLRAIRPQFISVGTDAKSMGESVKAATKGMAESVAAASEQMAKSLSKATPKVGVADQVDAFQQLILSYKDAVEAAQTLGAELGRNDTKFLSAAKSAQEFRNRIDDINNEIKGSNDSKIGIDDPYLRLSETSKEAAANARKLGAELGINSEKFLAAAAAASELKMQVDGINSAISGGKPEKALSAYDQLVLKWKEADEAAKNLGAELGRNNPQFLLAAKNANQLKEEIDGIKNAFKENTGNILALDSPYKRLSGLFREAAAEAKNFGASLVLQGKDLSNKADAEVQTWQKMSKSANDYNESLKKIDSEVGQNGRNVGNYKSAWNGLANSLQQSFREIPSTLGNFNMMALALSNNLPILGDEIGKIIEKNKALKADGQPTVSLFKQLGESVFSWQTALLVGIGLMVKYGGQLVDYIKNANSANLRVLALAESQKYLNEQTKQMHDSIKSATSSAQEQGEKLLLLNKIATDNALTYNVRAKAARELQEEQTGTLKNYSEEAIMTGKVSDIITTKLIPAYKAAAIAQAASSEIGRLTVEKAYQETNRQAQDNFRRTIAPQMEQLKRISNSTILNTQGVTLKAEVPKGLIDIGEAFNKSTAQTAQTDNNLKGINSRMAILNGLVDANVRKGAVGIVNTGNKKTGNKREYDPAKSILENARDEQKALDDANKSNEEANVTHWKTIADDDNNGIQARIAAFNKENESLLKINEIEKKEALNAIQTKLDEISHIEGISADKRTSAQKDLLNKRQSILETENAIEAKYATKAIDINAATTKSITTATEKYIANIQKLQKELTGIGGDNDKSKISFDLDTQKMGFKESLNTKIAALNEQYNSGQIAANKYAEALRAVQEQEAQGDKSELENNIKDLERQNISLEKNAAKYAEVTDRVKELKDWLADKKNGVTGYDPLPNLSVDSIQKSIDKLQLQQKTLAENSKQFIANKKSIDDYQEKLNSLSTQSIQKQMEQFQKKMDAMDRFIGKPIDDAFKALESGKNVIESLGDSIKSLIIQLVEAAAKAAIMAAIFGNSKQGQSMGGFGGVFSSLFGKSTGIDFSGAKSGSTGAVANAAKGNILDGIKSIFGGSKADSIDITQPMAVATKNEQALTASMINNGLGGGGDALRNSLLSGANIDPSSLASGSSGLSSIGSMGGLSSMGNPASMIIGALSQDAEASDSGTFKDIMKGLSIAGMALPFLADGGIVSGPTHAVVGEYPGASSNPEVIAPLSKLKSIIGSANGSQSIDVNVQGDLGYDAIRLSNKRGVNRFNR